MKKSYYLYKGGRLQRKDNSLEIAYKDGSKKSIPVENVDDIYIMTEFDLNTSLLNFISQYGENFFNNTIPVLLIINKTMNYSYEIQINDFANSWYLHVNDANCEYQVELGRRHKENPNYYYVTTSNNLDMPNNHILLENISNNVLFKNVKTQELVEKPITSITFFKDFAKSKDFYKYFKELLNNELEGDEINFNLPSSHTSSSFK